MNEKRERISHRQKVKHLPENEKTFREQFESYQPDKTLDPSVLFE